MKKTPEFLPEARNPLTFLDPLIDPECYIGKVVSCSVRSYDYSANEMEVFIGNSFYNPSSGLVNGFKNEFPIKYLA